MTNLHALVDESGSYSADPRDYFLMAPSARFEGLTLVRRRHPFRTVTGLVVTGPRPIKTEPTLRDLHRIARAAASRQERTR